MEAAHARAAAAAPAGTPPVLQRVPLRPSRQVLSTRARKDVALADVKVAVCVYAFDCLYLNGTSLLKAPLTQRRDALRASLVEAPGQLALATAKTSADVEELGVRRCVVLCGAVRRCVVAMCCMLCWRARMLLAREPAASLVSLAPFWLTVPCHLAHTAALPCPALPGLPERGR